MRRRIIRRGVATADIERAAAWYLEQAGLGVAERFVAAAESALMHAAAHPAAGSTRYEPWLGRPGLRFRLVKDFPYLVFYRDGGDYIDVWRVLHAERDIPTSLRKD